MIIAIEGPEKVGKSTLANIIASSIPEVPMKIRHWGPVYPDDRAYTGQLIEDTRADRWIIWDRCWPSEHVYGKLLSRKRRLVNDPWLGEWLHGRALQVSGVKVMLLPRHVEDLIKRRDGSDLPVNPGQEVLEYIEYAKRFDWEVFVNDYKEETLLKIADFINKRTIPKTLSRGIKPPEVAGVLGSGVVFVGEARNDGGKAGIPGSWLPFTSRLTIKLGRALGDMALKCAWTNIGDIHPDLLRDKSLVACGEKAYKWCKSLKCHKLMSIPHPSWLFRFNDEHSLIVRGVIGELKIFVKGELSNG